MPRITSTDSMLSVETCLASIPPPAVETVLASSLLSAVPLEIIWRLASLLMDAPSTTRAVPSAFAVLLLMSLIESELDDILNRRGGNSTMFNCVDHAPYGNYQSKLNKLLVKVSNAVGEKVTLERMRRTWATIASELEVPDRVIDKSMGHVDSTVKDRYYEKYDWSRTAKYNRMIIDYIWQGVVPNSICC